eukprot:scaffold101089_cov23-Tisochrysis_lutea.AAC.2
MSAALTAALTEQLSHSRKATYHVPHEHGDEAAKVGVQQLGVQLGLTEAHPELAALHVACTARLQAQLAGPSLHHLASHPVQLALGTTCSGYLLWAQLALGTTYSGYNLLWVLWGDRAHHPVRLALGTKQLDYSLTIWDKAAAVRQAALPSDMSGQCEQQGHMHMDIMVTHTHDHIDIVVVVIMRLHMLGHHVLQPSQLPIHNIHTCQINIMVVVNHAFTHAGIP